MREFKAANFWILAGRGVVIDVLFEGTREEWNPQVLIGEKVDIDRTKFLVKGVEMFRHHISSDRPYHGYVGLLV